MLASAPRARGARTALSRAADAIARMPAPPDPFPERVCVVLLDRRDPPAPEVTGPIRCVRREVEPVPDADVVCLLATGCEPLDQSWLARLVAALDGDAVAAAPLLLHPRRQWAHATPHDGRIRARGVDVVMGDDDAPALRAVAAGRRGDVVGGPIATYLAVGCLAVTRAAFDSAGGLRSLGDPDLDLVDLCVRLQRSGGSVVVVPSAAMVDRRPVPERAALHSPITDPSEARRRLVSLHGPTLLRRAAPPGDGVLRFALTCSAPSVKVAERWGDWHLTEAFGRALARLGHEVRVQTADRANSLAGRSRDVHVVVRGLTPVRATPGQRHVLWVISHPELVADDECAEADLVLVASSKFADELRGRTRTPVEVMLQATDPERFHPLPRSDAHAHEVTVVAKTRDVLRSAVADAVSAGLRPAIHGSGWESFVDPSLVVASHVPNDRLPLVYSSAGVVLNDHWDTMREWGFVSNRLFDVLACGTPVISDSMPEITELFDDTVPTYRDAGELRALVEADLAAPEDARARAARGREIVLGSHTFDHRAAQLLDALERHGLVAPETRALRRRGA